MPTMNTGLGGPAGYGENVFSSTPKTAGSNDDGSIQVDITSVFGASGINFFGTNYTDIYINSNGQITFAGPQPSPFAVDIPDIAYPAIVPFLTDIDITKGGEIYWDLDAVGGTVTVTWLTVAPHSGSGTNSFQVVLTSTGGGDFDVEFIYEDIQWANGGFGDATGGVTDGSGTFYEVPGSGTGSSVADWDITDFDGAGPDPAGVFSLSVVNPVVVDGTSGNDTMSLGYTDIDGDSISTGADIIDGADGDDSIDGDAGDDLIYGGAGDDTIDGGTNFDTIYGGDGNDVLFEGSIGTSGGELYGEAGNDTLYGGTGNASDLLDGGDGDDQLIGQGAGGSDDTLLGGAGNDSLQGDDGADFMRGDSMWLDPADHASGPGGAAVNLTVNNTTDGDIELWWIEQDGSLTFYATVPANDTVVQPTFTDHTWVLRDPGGLYLQIIEVTGALTVDYGIDGLDDTVDGGLGNDTIFGEFGNDLLDGGDGDDSIDGGFGDDTLRGDAGADTILGGAGRDSIYGGDGDDSLEGGADQDRFLIWTGGGNDTIVGGETGADTDIIGFGAADVVNVTMSGNETGTALTGVYTVTFSEIETLDLSIFDDVYNGSATTSGMRIAGAAGNDTITGGSGADTLLGGDGFDDLTGGAGDDSLEGGAGADEYCFGDGWGNDTVTDATTSWLDFLDVTTGITFTATGVDAFSATDGVNTVSGTTGTFSSIYLSQGNDYVDLSGMTANSIQYVYGNYTGATGTDTIIGSDFDDQVYVLGDNGEYFAQLGGGNDYIEATDQNDTLFGEDGNDTLRGFGGNDYLAGGDGDDQFFNSEGNNTLIGGAGNDWFFADDGSNQIWGGTGNDTIEAEAGDDTIFVEDGFGADTVTGGETAEGRGDRLDFSAMALAGITVTYSGNEAGTATDGTDTLGYSEIEALTLTAQADSVDASVTTAGVAVDGLAGNDTLAGGTGADTLTGGDGDDSIQGGDGDDLLKTGQGTDTVEGGAGNDTLMNSAGDDSLVGGTGDDLLVASAGNDTLEGGDGFDTLMGGTDSDSLDGGADNDLLLGDLAGIRFNESGTDGVGLATNLTEFPTTQLSYEVTFASTQDASSALIPLGNYMAGSGTNDFVIQANGGVIQLDIDFVGPLDTTINTATLFDGLDHTLALTWDSATGALEIYVDGASAFSATYATGASISQGGTFVLGQEQDSVGGGFDPAQSFDGTIYGVRLYNDVRSSAELLDSTHGPVADTSDPNLIANWVPDPDSNTITDRTGSHTMTLSGDTSATWSADADTLTGGDGDDTLYGGGGNDSLEGGGGNDSLQGNAGNDTLRGHAGNDTLEGGDGDDRLFDTSGTDLLRGGAGNDSLDGGLNTDTVEGGSGNDTLISFSDADSLSGGDDADVFRLYDGGMGSTITGGEGGADDDTLDLSNVTSGVTVTFSDEEGGTITDGADTLTFSEIENHILTDQNDSVDASVVWNGVFGDNPGIDIAARGGDDTVIGGWGGDTIDGGAGNDSILADYGDDSLTGGTGNDSFAYFVGNGDDTITDFNAGTTGTISDGDTTNNDFIDLSSLYDNLSELYADYADDGILNQSNTTDSKGRTVDYSDNAQFLGGDSLTFQGASADSSSFTVENTAVVCFAAGTLIQTPTGEVPVETLRPGDLVVTRDNGPKALLWSTAEHVGGRRLQSHANLRPIQVKGNAFGSKRDLIVSPQHAILTKIAGEDCLVRAKHLCDLDVPRAHVISGRKGVTYIHLAFDGHEILFANGVPAESFFPGPMSLAALGPVGRARLNAHFPDVSKPGSRQWTPARPYATRRDLRESGVLSRNAHRPGMMEHAG